MNVEVQNEISISGWAFLIIQLYSIIRIIINQFNKDTTKLFATRASQLQQFDIYSKIFQVKMPSFQSKYQEYNAYLQLNNFCKELAKYICSISLKMSKQLGQKLEKTEIENPLMSYLDKNNLIQVFSSKISLYKAHLKIIMQKYHFLVRLFRNGRREKVLEIDQIIVYLTIQISTLVLIDYIGIKQGNYRINDINSTQIVAYIAINQIFISPISIFLARNAYLIHSLEMPLHQALYQSSFESSKQKKMYQQKLQASLKRASIISKIFECLNLFLLIISSFQMGRFYQNQFSETEQQVKRIYFHLMVTLYEILIGRFASCIFIWLLQICLTKFSEIVQIQTVHLFQQFFEDSLKIKDKYNHHYQQAKAEYLFLIKGGLEEECSQQKTNLMSIVTLSQQPFLEKFNTISTFNKKQAFFSNQNNATISTTTLFKQKNLTKNIPSIYQLRQLTGNKTMTDYENTFPIINSPIRQDTQNENIHNTTQSKLDESFIKEEEKIPAKLIKDFKKQCFDFQNRHHFENYQIYSDRSIKKANSLLTNQRGSFDTSFSLNILPLQDLDIPGISKKSSNFIPMLQSNSYQEGTNQMVSQRESKSNQLSFLNHSLYSNSSVVNSKSQNQKISINQSQKHQKSSMNSIINTQLRLSNSKSLSKYSSLKSQSSLPKLNPIFISQNEHQIHFDQKENFSSQEDCGSKRILDNQIKEQFTKINSFRDKEQILVNLVENKKKQFLEEKQPKIAINEIFQTDYQPIDCIQKNSLNISDFMEKSDLKAIFNEKSVKIVSNIVFDQVKSNPSESLKLDMSNFEQ